MEQPFTKFIELPNEIIDHVLNFLELKDRKNVRLSCNWLRDLCNSPKITKNEKFFFYNITTLDAKKDLGRYILECKYMRTHCEFHGLDLTATPNKLEDEVWQKFGDQLQSLLFYNCVIDILTFKNIVINCPNLRNLNFTHFHYHKCDIDKYWYPLFLSEYIIDEILDEKIERKKLVSFEIYGYKVDSLVVDRIWKKIFLIYPCIRTFGERILQWTGNSYSSSNYALERELESDDNATNARYPFGEWVFPPNIEDFSSNRCMTKSWRMPEFKFKKLSIVLSVHHIRTHMKDKVPVFGFFSNQTKLESLKLRLCTRDCQTDNLNADDVDLLKTRFLELLDILKKLPKLKYFTLQTDKLHKKDAPYISLFRYLLVLVSQLDSVKMVLGRCPYNSSTVNVLDTSDLQLLSPQQCKNLKELCLELRYVRPWPNRILESSIISEILQRCCDSLEHLELYGMITTDHIFERISALRALRKLKVNLAVLPENRCRLKITLANLKNLQYLALREITIETLEESLLTLFPENLTCLCISVAANWQDLSRQIIWIQSLDVITMSLPKLKILKIERDGIGYITQGNSCLLDLAMNYCRRLKNLQFLRIWWFKWMVGHDYSQFQAAIEALFIELSSLRSVDYTDGIVYNEYHIPSYTYNRSSKGLVPLFKEEDIKGLWRMANEDSIESLDYYPKCYDFKL